MVARLRLEARGTTPKSAASDRSQSLKQESDCSLRDSTRRIAYRQCVLHVGRGITAARMLPGAECFGAQKGRPIYVPIGSEASR